MLFGDTLGRRAQMVEQGIADAQGAFAPAMVGGLVEKSQLPYQAAALAKRYLHECTASVQGLGSHLEHH